MPTSLAFDFKNYLAVKRAAIEEKLGQYLADRDPDILFDSIRYSVLAGGKRIRGVLCLAAAEATADHRLSSEEACNLALPCACAIEMIHAMSLIHDDLPCMDNDDFRRGRPTNHKVYGEALSLLAGDALMMLAIETLVSQPDIPAERLAAAVLAFTKATGAKGMVGGQVADMAATGNVIQEKDLALELLQQIHTRKTGALLKFAVWSGAYLAGAEPAVLNSLEKYGDILGLSFQIADDLLDVTGDISTLGKTPGKDLSSGKLTWISLYGIDGACQKLSELASQGKEILQKCPLSSKKALIPLHALLEYAASRTS